MNLETRGVRRGWSWIAAWPVATCSAGVRACEFWWRPAAMRATVARRDALANSQARRPRYFFTGPGTCHGLGCHLLYFRDGIEHFRRE
jgi:hypothetical protein